MLSIFQTQLFRLKKSKLFWALLIVCAALPLLGALFAYMLILIVDGVLDVGLAADLLGFTTLAQLGNFANLASDCALFSLICSSVVLCREFTQGTMRNAVLANKSRKQLYFSYLLTAILIGLVYMLTEFVMTLASYGIIFGFDGMKAGAVITALLCDLVLGICAQLFVHTCVCLFMFSTRKQSATICFPLLICILGPGLITGIINGIILSRELAGAEISEKLLQCLPFYNMQMLDPQNPAGLVMGMVVLYDLLFAAMFLLIGMFTFEKADLK